VKLFVLAGGFGSRLRSVLFETPKVLAPVGEIPFLRFQIENWKRHGINSFVFLLHHQAHLVISFLKNEQELGVLVGCDVCWVIEPTPMGTGGAVAYAIEKLNYFGNFMVTNADTWLGSGFLEIAEVTAPSICVIEMKNTGRYGRVEFDENNYVTRFLEKSNMQGTGWVNAGLSRLCTDFFKDWDHLPFSLEQLTFPEMVTTGKLRVVKLTTDFIDIGIPDDYNRFRQWIQSNCEGSLLC